MGQRFDVVVIGAGASGLAAARTLAQGGRRVAVLEARPRLGGRILTVHDPAWPLPIDLGAEFVHGDAPSTRAIARAAGLSVVDLHDVHLWRHRSGLLSIGPVWSELAQVRRRIPARGPDLSFGAFLARRRSLSPRLRELARSFIEGYFAAPLDRVSARWLRSGSDDEEESQARQSRLLGGYDGIVHALRASLPPERAEVWLGRAVQEVRWRRGTVEVACRGPLGAIETFRARAAVVTLPLGVLKVPSGEPGAVRFTPSLAARQEALSGLEVGHVCKLTLRFREAFWEEEGFLEERMAPRERSHPDHIDFLHDSHGAFPTWWTARPLRLPVLTAWAGGPRADALLELDERALVAKSLDTLGALLRLERRWLEQRLEAWQRHDWGADPYSRGAYSYVGVGGATAPRRLAEPLEGTLFFAGEATVSDEMGTVAGALTSGGRAAQQLLDGIKA